MIAYTNYSTDPRVIREAEAAVSAGMDVDFLALRRQGDPKVEMTRGVRVIHLSQRRYRGNGLLRYMLSYLEFFCRCFFKITLLHLKRPYRAIHVNNMPDFLVFSTVIARLLGARIILDIHDPMPNTFASKFKGGETGLIFKMLLWQELLSASYSHRVLTVHDPLKDLVLVKHGLRADSIHVIANFADDQLFPLRSDFRANGKLTLIFHGTILERYGLRTLMEALSLVKHRDRMSVRIIGEGDFSGELSRLIASLCLGDFVQFDNRVYPVYEIPRIIADCNLGMVPLEISSITNYALPLKMLEYISMGLPVVTVRNAAIGYYFSESDCLFYRPHDAESLQELLDRLASNSDLLACYHQKSVAMRERFLWSNEKKKYIALLRELGC